MKPTAAIVASAELSAAERSEFLTLSKQIIARQQGYYKDGLALKIISQKRLYRASSKTFEEYCERHLDMSRSRAYQLIEAADIAANVHKCGQIPLNESQARCLAGLEPEDQRKAWKKALDTTRGTITAAYISRCVEEITGLPPIEAEQSDIQAKMFDAMEPEMQAEYLNRLEEKQAKAKAPKVFGGDAWAKHLGQAAYHAALTAKHLEALGSGEAEAELELAQQLVKKIQKLEVE